ncbi:MAG TPA: hypothetical protein DCM67_03650 [Propionibacteriaceae bacterium]|nr:hypothetical protein [Propionibacteriaceae bacterium]
MNTRRAAWALISAMAASAMVVASGAGFSVTVARATSTSDSALSVAWNADTSRAAAYQPARDATSKHYQDFKNLTVSVDQTKDLIDQTVTVKVTGMPGATAIVESTGGTRYEFGSNFLQAMQCWGDPQAADFYKNCEWGAFEYDAKSAPSVLIGEETGVGNANGRGTTFTSSYFKHPGELDVPFRAVDGTIYSSGATDSVSQDAPILDVFNATTTNERTMPVESNGSVTFEFETQSSASQPYLGCGGTATATSDQCWLVVVPRGEHNSTSRDYCTTNLKDYPAAQQGSPVNPNCDYWGNRVVVPLTFRPTTDACATGGSEIPVGGSELAQNAISSWQRELCRATSQAFTFTSSADALAREQLVSGQASAVFTMRPITAKYVSDSVTDSALAATKVVYAPMAVASIGIAYVANNDGASYTNLKLTPRLIAKLVTNSYAWSSGLGLTTGVGGLGVLHTVPDSTWKLPASAWQSPVRALRLDPEFTELNPDVNLTGNGSLVLVGPNGSDAVAALWNYLQADDKARAFLAGQADNVREGDSENAGMTINPYYLPKSYAGVVPTMVEKSLPNTTGTKVSTLVPKTDSDGAYLWTKVGLADSAGNSLCLCDADIDTLGQSDQTLMPRMLTTESQPRYDMSQAVPYAASFAAAANRVFKVNTGSKTTWNPNSNLPNGGTYSSDGQLRWTNAFINGVTSYAEAERLGLPMAALQVPNQPKTFVSASTKTMSTAVAARTASTVTGFSMVPDADALPATAYPLTGIVYLAVDASIPAAQRRAYADLIDTATSAQGQSVGTAIGELPEGYAPLSAALRSQAGKAADSLRKSTPATSSPTPSASSSNQPAGTSSAAAPASQPSAGSGLTPVDFPSPTPAPTPDSTTDGPPTAIYGGVLVASVIGLAAGPFLLRRRRLGP